VVPFRLKVVRIDLHVHSSASDGSLPPADVVAAAVAAGLDVVALTDHDTVEGWPEAVEAARRLGIALLPGVEISCTLQGTSVHLLAYLQDPDDARLRAEFAITRDDRVARARRMVQRIAEDYPLTWDDVVEHVAEGATVGRPHIADAMVARGLARTRDEAFETTLHRTSPYFESHYSPQAAEVVRLVRKAGGVPVMAHPRAGQRGRVVADEEIAGLAAAGLFALEADHPDHTPQERVAVRRLAEDLGLLVTGSSDYHGPARPNGLGAFTTAPEVFQAIVDGGHGTRFPDPDGRSALRDPDRRLSIADPRGRSAVDPGGGSGTDSGDGPAGAV
jgi:predicted metal-dependent phosphoesterase TrpH